MKFSEMPYKRIDMEEVEKEYKSIIERTKNAKSGEEQFEIDPVYFFPLVPQYTFRFDP